jgi:hypothetical protein
MLSRRSIIRGGCSYLASPILAVPIAAVRIDPANAWIMAAIAIAEVCIALIGLFQKKGPGIPGLLSKQMDALQEISQEIGVINQKLDLIYQTLEEMRKLLEELPDAVVTAQNQALVEGAFNRHRELLNAYIFERNRSGIEAALNATSGHFESEVLQRIRVARDDLFNRRVESTIPSLARALQVEMQTMILLNYPTGLIRSAISAYQQWFGWWGDDTVAGAFPKQLAKLQEEAKALDLGNKGLFGIWRCYKDVKFAGGSGGLTFLGATEVTYQLNGKVSQDQQSEIDEGMDLWTAGGEFPDFNTFLDLRVADLVGSTKPVPAWPPQDPVVALPGICPANVDDDLKSSHSHLVETAATIRTRLLAKTSLAFVAKETEKSCGTYLNSDVLK